MKNRKQDGVAFIELIMLVAVMAIALTTLVPDNLNYLERARENETRENLEKIETAIRSYFLVNNSFPPNLRSLSPNFMTVDYNSTEGTDNNITYDKWRRSYYLTNFSATRLRVTSGGADKRRGGSDDITVDIDTSYIRDQKTLREMTALQKKVDIYNALSADDSSTYPAFTTDWDDALDKMITAGLIASGSKKEYSKGQDGKPYKFNGTKIDH